MKVMGSIFRRFRNYTERGTTYIEISMMSLIAAIVLVSLSQAITSTTRGAIAAKERARAQSLAQDRLEEVKNMGFTALSMRVSNYYYPDNPDPQMPLMQLASATPYPVTTPNAGDDPWTPEGILIGKRTYWRHVKVKFVEPDPDVASGQLVQSPKPLGPNGSIKTGGNNPGSNLAFIEVDVTWFSPRLGRREQIRLSTLVASSNINTLAFGSISGTVLDTGDDKLDTAGSSTLQDFDDKPISWSALIVVARNILTEDKYTTKIDTSKINPGEYGYYKIQNVPNGAYEVLVYGAPRYYDGGYNGKNTPAGTNNQTVSVSVSMFNMQATNTNIWLNKAMLVKIYGQFIGVNGSLGSTKFVQVYNSDFSSTPIELSVTQNCASAAPCWFVLNDVAWPATGKVLWKTMVVNLTDKVAVGVTLCADASVVPIPSPASSTAYDFYVGMAPPVGDFPCSSGCQPSYPNLGTDCVYPGESGAYGPVNLVTPYSKPTLRVKVKEYYNGAEWDLDSAVLPLVRIGFLSTNDGISATLGLASDSTTIFKNMTTGEGLIPIQPPPTIKLKAWVNTTGYTEDSYFLPFPTDPGVDYSLIESDLSIGEPVLANRYTFRLIRVSAVSGTVWLVAGIKGFVNASVRIALQSSAWNNVMVTGGAGQFLHEAIPMNAGTDYTISPIVGADYVATPPFRYVTIDKNGLVYTKDKFGAGLEFTLLAINGGIHGTVTKKGKLVTEGATIIATTYTGALPATLPATQLSEGAYTYSTVSYSDGTYRLKVGTGLGKYYIHVITKQDGESQVGPLPAGGLTVNADTDVLYDVAIP